MQKGETVEADSAPAVEPVCTIEEVPAGRTSCYRCPAVAAKPQGGGKVRATPARNWLGMGIDLGLVPGTGANGRVHKVDVEDFKDKAPKGDTARTVLQKLTMVLICQQSLELVSMVKLLRRCTCVLAPRTSRSGSSS